MSDRPATVRTLLTTLLLGCVAVGAYLALSTSAPSSERHVPDSQLGWRGNPAHIDYDSAGFPNADADAYYDLVVLGDEFSEAPALPLPRAGSWPRLFSQLTGRATYVMALAGYGPGQYDALASTIASSKPATLVIQIYLGDDFADAYNWVYTRGKSAHLLPKDQGRIRTMESWEDNHGPLPSDSGKSLPLRVESLDVVLAPDRRFALLNGNDPRIAEGLRITMAAIGALRSACGQGCQTIVVLIPSKERVFWPHLEATALPDSLRLSTTYEDKLRAKLQSWLSAAVIPALDVLPQFDALVAESTNPFVAGDASGLSPAGHHAVAAALHQADLLSNQSASN